MSDVMEIMSQDFGKIIEMAKVNMKYTFNVKNVEGYGAEGDSITDDKAAIQQAIDSAEADGGGIVYFPPGTYRVSGELIGYSNVSFVGSGKEQTVLLFDDTPSTGISYTGSHAGGIALAADVAIGDRSITLASGGGANYATGAMIYIQDNASYNGTFTTFVKSVVGDVVSLQEASPYNFSTGSGATAYYYSSGNPIVKGAYVKDLTIRTTGSSLPSNLTTLINFTRCLGGVVENVHFDNSKSIGMQLLGCRDTIVRDCSFERIGTQGDMVSVQSSTCCIVESCVGHNAPFGIVGARSSFLNVNNNIISGKVGVDNGRGIKMESGCTQCIITDNKISDFGLYGIFISDSFSNVVTENVIFGSGADTGQHGIVIGGNLPGQCSRNVIANNKLNYISGYGIVINPTSGNAVETFCNVNGNVLSRTNNGINLASSRNIVTGNTLDNYGGGGIGIFCSPSTTKNVITNNTFQNSFSGKAIDTASSAGGNYVVNNATFGETVNLAATDTTEPKTDIIPLRPSGYGATGLSVTSSTFATQGYRIFPGTSKYRQGATFTLVIILGVSSAATTAEYRLASDGAGTVYGTSSSNATGRNKLRTVLTNLPSAETIIQEDFRSTDNTNNAIVYSAYIEVSW